MKAATGEPRVNSSLDSLAPCFSDAVIAALAECKTLDLDANVYETYRSPELQALYYARGRTIIPPNYTVTNAKTNVRSWHGYGLAVDVIHRTKFWKPEGGEAWFAEVADVFKRNNCSWGGDWTKPDTPHFQWHLCAASPSSADRALIASQGLYAVWQSVNAV